MAQCHVIVLKVKAFHMTTVDFVGKPFTSEPGGDASIGESLAQSWYKGNFLFSAIF